MLTILHPTSVPPGGFVFRDPNTDFLIKHNNLENLFNLATRHRAANGLELSVELFTETVCASTKGIGCSDGEMPNLLVQARNLAGEMATWIKSGFEKAPKDILSKRLGICESCQHWGGQRGGSLIKGRCKLCGCYGIKLALATSVCPAGKW